MRQMKNKLFQPRDLFLILPLLVLAVGLLLLFSNQNGSATAIVEQDGTELYRFDLSRQTEAETIGLGGNYHITLLLEPGAISFSHSDCPDQVCVRTGKLTKPGQAAVCLPAKVSVRIAGNEKEYDAYTGY